MAATLLSHLDVSPMVLPGCADPGITEPLTALLDNWHFPVEVAENGADALARMRSSAPPEIALPDIELAAFGGRRLPGRCAAGRRRTARGWSC